MFQCIPVTCLSFLPAVNLKLRDNVVYLYTQKYGSYCTEDHFSIFVQLNLSLNSLYLCHINYYFLGQYMSILLSLISGLLHCFFKNLILIQETLAMLWMPRSISSNNHWIIKVKSQVSTWLKGFIPIFTNKLYFHIMYYTMNHLGDNSSFYQV